jgi:hypothetical protein
MALRDWDIKIDDFMGGFAPAWYKETYPTYGNKNQAGAMQNIDLTNPGYLTQGPGLADLTNGNQVTAITTLVNSVIDEAVAADLTYGIGGTEVYEISSTAVTNTGQWPHTITAASGTAVGEDIAIFRSNAYYTYNDATAGEIGKFDLTSTWDDNWGSTVPTSAGALENAPHPIVVGNDIMHIGNGRYIATYDGTELVTQALDLPTGTIIEDIEYNEDKVWAATNLPNLTGSNKARGSIYIWNGTTTEWEDEIRIMGEIGAMHLRNNVIFVWYRDVSSTGGYKIAYISDGSVVDLANYTGSLPKYSQITDYKDFILWHSDGKLFAYGSGDTKLPVRLQQLADCGYATVGAVAAPFGTPMIASTDGAAGFRLAKFSGYDVASNYKTLNFDITTDKDTSKIDTVLFNFETLATGAVCDWKLLDNQGKTIYSDTISYAKAILGGPTHSLTNATYKLNGLVAENFRVELDFTNGSTTNPVKIKNIKIYGTHSK